MITVPEARQILQQAGMVHGLDYAEVHKQIALSLRVGECMQRRLAFFLVEMREGELYKHAAGCKDIFVYAEMKHGLSERRTREMLRVGGLLLELPAIDGALCRQEIRWSEMLLLLRIAIPETEEAWLEYARKLSYEKLKGMVRRHKHGEMPNAGAKARGRGTPAVHHPVKLRLPTAAHQKQVLAMQKLRDERERQVTTAELQEVLLDLYLQMERKGHADGWKKVPSSLYRLHLRPLGPSGADEAPLWLETDEGLMPIEGTEHDDVVARNREACAKCDAQRVGDGEKVKDEPTPGDMRRRVLDRDGHRCRCCGSRDALHVHHIEFRSDGGPTKVWNLLPVCIGCHSLIHDGLLRVQGKTQKKARFVDAEGRVLHEKGRPVDPAVLIELEKPEARSIEEQLGAYREEAEEARDATRSLPETVDGRWWQENADRIRCRDTGSMTWDPKRPTRIVKEPVSGAACASEDAFADVIGQEALIEQIETEARAAKA